MAFGPLGWKAVAFSEIEPFPCAVLKHHYPDVPNFGDMTKFKDWPEEVFASADAVVGGPPCQAFSVAGLRKGLTDARGNLTLVYVELINHADLIRKKYGKPPVIALYENVPGLLSDKTGAYGCLLGALAGEDGEVVAPGGKWTDAGCVFGPERTIAWRLFDAQYHAVAQRRRRVFVVASARNGFDPAAVLFEFDGVRRDSPPSRETRQGVAGGVEIGPGGGRLTDLNPTLDTRAKDGPIRNQLAGAVMQPVAATLMSSFGRLLGTSGQDADHGHSHLVAFGGNNTAGAIDVAPGLNCNGGQRSGDFEAGALLLQQVTHSLRGEGFDASEDGTWRGTPLVPVAGAICGHSFVGGAGGRPEGAAAGHFVPVAFHPTQDPISSTNVCHTIGANDNATAAVAVSSGHGWWSESNGTAQTLRAQDSITKADTLHISAMQVRRLTPTECERLQGFPDGYTAIPWRGKPADQCPDGPRYKALGNSWAVPNVRWIGQRIVDHLAKRPT